MEISELLPDIDDIKKYIGLNENCIVQIIDFIPKDILASYACEVFFYYLDKGYKNRIKSPEIFFLTLLYGSLNINKILNKIKNSQKKYIIKCCRNEKNNYKKINKETRIQLSNIAINSLETLI